MILFFRTPSKSVIATQVDHQLDSNEINELCWLFGDAVLEKADSLEDRKSTRLNSSHTS